MRRAKKEAKGRLVAAAWWAAFGVVVAVNCYLLVNPPCWGC